MAVRWKTGPISTTAISPFRTRSEVDQLDLLRRQREFEFEKEKYGNVQSVLSQYNKNFDRYGQGSSDYFEKLLGFTDPQKAMELYDPIAKQYGQKAIAATMVGAVNAGESNPVLKQAAPFRAYQDEQLAKLKALLGFRGEHSEALKSAGQAQLQREALETERLRTMANALK